MLLEVLKGVRAAKGSEWDCEMIFDHGGSLLEEFARVGRIRVLSNPLTEGSGLVARALRRSSKWVPFKARRFAGWVREWEARGGGVIYSNTGTNGRLLRALPQTASPVISHIHELAYGLRRFSTSAELAATLSRTNIFLSVSAAVDEDLNKLGVARRRIRRIPNFLIAMPNAMAVDTAKTDLCFRLSIPSNSRIVTACGHVDWVKGTDLFVEIANFVIHNCKKPPVFIWIGGHLQRRFALKSRAKLSAAAQPFVHFVGEVMDVTPYFAASEVVLVTSRVESFSRVALEAGALSRPVLAFAAARGPADLLNEEQLVADLDPRAMAVALEALLAGPAEAARIGAQLRDRVERDFLAGKWIGEIIKNVEMPRRG